MVERTLGAVGRRVSIDDLLRVTAAHTGYGRPLTEDADVGEREVVYALRTLGYAGRGNPGTPVFEATTERPAVAPAPPE